MKKIVVFLSVLLLVSCNDTGVEKPEHLIEKDEMIAILYDITLLQASENVNAAKIKEEGVKANDFIYKKYNNQNVTDTTSWAEQVKVDFLQFEKLGMPTEDFERILNLLK